MRVNGKSIKLDEPIRLKDFLMKQTVDFNCLGVALNGNVIKKSDYQDIILENEDQLELICFVGGG